MTENKKKLALQTLPFDRFSKFLPVLLAQVKFNIQTRKYFLVHVHKDYLLYKKKGIGETNILQQFLLKSVNGFVDMPMCILLNV